MIHVDLNNVSEANDYNNPAPGGYVAQIMQVELVEEKQYIKLYMDIVEGEFSNYYETLYDRAGFWGLTNIRSYKPKALPFFKQMVTAVTESNEGFVWDGDEQKLDSKYVGIILQNEQYTKNDGSLGIRLIVNRFTSVDNIRKGNYTVPETKWLKKDDNVSLKPGVFEGVNTSNGRMSGVVNEGFMQVKEDKTEGIPFK